MNLEVEHDLSTSHKHSQTGSFVPNSNVTWVLTSAQTNHTKKLNLLIQTLKLAYVGKEIALITLLSQADTHSSFGYVTDFIIVNLTMIHSFDDIILLLRFRLFNFTLFHGKTQPLAFCFQQNGWKHDSWFKPTAS